jgi:23S rRNA A2030 N6-methylase RlmJ
MVSFENEEERDKFLEMLDVTVHKKNLGTVSIWWPEKDREDPHSLRFQREAPEGGEELLAELLEGATEVPAS